MLILAWVFPLNAASRFLCKESPNRDPPSKCFAGYTLVDTMRAYTTTSHQNVDSRLGFSIRRRFPFASWRLLGWILASWRLLGWILASWRLLGWILASWRALLRKVCMLVLQYTDEHSFFIELDLLERGASWAGAYSGYRTGTADSNPGDERSAGEVSAALRGRHARLSKPNGAHWSPIKSKKGPHAAPRGPKWVTNETQIGPWTQNKPLLKWAHGLHTRAS